METILLLLKFWFPVTLYIIVKIIIQDSLFIGLYG